MCRGPHRRGLRAQARRDWLLAAGALWIGAFGLFLLRYAPLLVRPRRSR